MDTDQVDRSAQEDSDNSNVDDGQDDGSTQDQGTVPRKALIAERKKRQAEARATEQMRLELAELKGQLDALKGSGKQEDDGDNFDELVDYSDIPGSIARVAEAIADKKAAKYRKQTLDDEQEAFNLLVEECRADAEEKYGADEVEEYLQDWIQMVNKDKRLGRLIMKQADPVEFAIRRVKKARGPKSEVEKLKQKIAELEGRSGPPKQTRGKRLADSTGTGIQPGAVESDKDVFYSAHKR